MTIRAFIIFLFLAISLVAYTQTLSLVTPIPNTLRETSGLIYLNQKLITHNDSGGSPTLYEVDTITGTVTRQVTLSNATNQDWEDICHDDTYIYVADFGNNSGARMNLKIYRVLISDYLQNNSVTADIINFSYADQTDFTPSNFSTNFDAEALISYKDSLYVFTKNWGNFKTNIYPLSKQPGTYSISKTDSIDTQGLITGADYDSTANAIVMCGYTLTQPFILNVDDISTSTFSSGTIYRRTFTQLSGYSIKIEGITHLEQDKYLFSAEESQSNSPGIFKWQTPLLTIKEKEETVVSPTLYPNPANHFIEVIGDDVLSIEIYDVKGRLQIKTKTNQVNTSTLLPGLYVVWIKTENQQYSKKLIINPQ